MNTEIYKKKFLSGISMIVGGYTAIASASAVADNIGSFLGDLRFLHLTSVAVSNISTEVFCIINLLGLIICFSGVFIVEVSSLAYLLFKLRGLTQEASQERDF